MGADSAHLVTISRVVYRRGYTLVEIGVTMLFLTIIAGIAVASYAGVLGATKSSTSPTVLVLAQLEARRLVANNAFAGFPNDLADDVTVPNVQITSGVSVDPDVVSVFVEDESTLVLAAGSDTGCLVLVDRLDGAPTWVRDADMTECAASLVAPYAVSVNGGSQAEPLEGVLG